MTEFLPYLAGALVLLIWIRGERNAARLRELHRSLDELRRELGIAPPLSTEPSAEVKRLAAQPGQTLEAIRRYRAESGADVRSAKAVVDGLRRGSGGA